MYHSIRDYGIDTLRITNHGVAIGCYFRDPENNHVEVYWSTGMDYPQPHGEPIDLDLSTPELVSDHREHGAEGRLRTAVLRPGCREAPAELEPYSRLYFANSVFAFGMSPMTAM